MRIIAAVVFVGMALTACIDDSHSHPALDARTVVQDAVAMYRDEGIDAVVEYHNRSDVNVVNYVVITASDGTILAHPDQTIVGTIEPGPLTDTGITALEATHAVANGGGGWVTHDYEKPATGETGRRHNWVQAADGYVFSSGHQVPNPRNQWRDQPVPAQQ